MYAARAANKCFERRVLSKSADGLSIIVWDVGVRTYIELS